MCSIAAIGRIDLFADANVTKRNDPHCGSFRFSFIYFLSEIGILYIFCFEITKRNALYYL